jgi:hypothetical protein
MADLLRDLTVVVVVVVTATLTAWAAIRFLGGLRPVQGADRASEGKSGRTSADPLDHERRLLVLEAKQRALELEWEDTRAKFLGMTRSFIRHAKAAGLDGAGTEDTPSAAGQPRETATSSRAAVLNAWRRKQGGGLNAKP